jgi:hypothetical protein
MMRAAQLVGPQSSAALWVLSGVCFAVYPMLRPFSSETGRAGADAFGSPLWLVAHLSAIVAFAALLLAATGTYAQVPVRPRTGRVAWLLLVVGVCLILPFYGAEAYGLHALGEAAVQADVPRAGDIVDIASLVRGGVGLAVFVAGAACLAAGGVVGIGATDPRTLRRWGTAVAGLALLLLIPQFLLDQPLRVAHGLLYLTGCALLAAGLLRDRVPAAAGEPERAR